MVESSAPGGQGRTSSGLRAEGPCRVARRRSYRRAMDEPISSMSTEECWTFLRTQELGRMAHHLADEVRGDYATSVVLRGRGRRLEEDEAHRAENVPLHPWVDTEKRNVVEIEPIDLSARRFPLTRPWRHLVPD